jgi:perosamine synthetase
MEKLAILGGPKAVEKPAATWPDDFLRMYGDKEIQALTRVIRSGTVWGASSPEVTAFQEEFARYAGTKHAVATNSGTAALHSAMAAAGVGPAVEVITSPHTFIASASSVLHHNGIPIFADIDPKTYTIDPEKIEQKITKYTKAIEPVHIYGLPADMDRIKKIADSYGLIVIEDASQAHGAVYKGKKVGSLGDMAAFSLNATKNMMSGEGGVVTTDNDQYADQVARVRIFGEAIRPGQPMDYKAAQMGWMYRMTELNAAFARVQLGRLDETNRVRIENAQYLTKKLERIAGFILPYVPSDRTSVYWHYKIRVDPEALDLEISAHEFRDRVVAALTAEGVKAAIWCKEPVYKQPLFQTLEGYGLGCPWKCPHVKRKIEYKEGDCPVAERISNETFDVQVHPPNGIDIMEEYVRAFEKVSLNARDLERIALPKWERWWGGYVPVKSPV